MNRRVAAYWAASLLIIPAYVLAQPGIVRALLWQVLVWLTVLAIVAGARLHRPATPGTWMLLAAGMGLMGLGSLADPAFAITVSHPASRPLLDAMTAVGYPVIGVVAMRFARAQSQGRDRGPILDSFIVTIALTTVLWEAALGRGVALGSSDLIAILAISASSAWVAAMTIRFHVAGGYRVPSGWLIIVASTLACLGSAAFVWSGSLAGGAANAGPQIAVAWIVSLILVGGAALHPSMVELTRPADVEIANVITRTVLPAIALLTPPAAAIARHLTTGETAVVATYASALIALVVVLRFADLMRTREQAQQRLQERMLHDPLTGLPNRVLLEDRLQHALRQRPGDDGDVGVAFIDLDGFKAVNDSLGHGAGDELLIQVAARMRATCRAGDTLARLGGDEFVYVLDGVGEDEAMALATRLLEVLCQPVILGEEEVAVGASIGLALAATVGRQADRLMVAADDAMYAAKHAGRGRVHLAGTTPPQPARPPRREDATILLGLTALGPILRP